MPSARFSLSLVGVVGVFVAVLAAASLWLVVSDPVKVATGVQAATQGGYASLGFDAGDDRVVLDRTRAALVGTSGDDDAVVFAANGACVSEVWVGGARIVERGVHPRYDEARRGYERALARLGLV